MMTLALALEISSNGVQRQLSKNAIKHYLRIENSNKVTPDPDKKWIALENNWHISPHFLKLSIDFRFKYEKKATRENSYMWHSRYGEGNSCLIYYNKNCEVAPTLVEN